MSSMSAKNDSPIFIFNEHEARYRFYDDHPFNQKRLLLTVELLRQIDALDPASILNPRFAQDHELLMVHSKDYVEAVKQLSCTSPSDESIRSAGRYGLDTEDTPYFEGMHEAASMIVGGSIQAAELVMSGQHPHALHLGGGLHHALRDKGAGFCVYNDASAAISYIKNKYHCKVLYIDTDVHHGDGVQWEFYADSEVCTLSIHETGKYLFPGTGGVGERGSGDAFGKSVNVPIEPYTEDESWMECFEEALEAVVKQFKPDVIVSQHGCDAHAFDPLAHIHCSMEIYRKMPALIHRYAHEYCDGKWIALGGGGYDIWRVVPRAWSLLWLEMNDHPLVAELSKNPELPLPMDWHNKHAKDSIWPLPTTWLDPLYKWEPMPRRTIITEKNREMKDLALMYLK